MAFKKRFHEMTAAAKAREAGDGSVRRRKYPVKTIDPETEKAINHMVEEQNRAESLDFAKARHMVGFKTPGLHHEKETDMFASTENIQSPRGGIRARARLDDIFNNHAVPHRSEEYEPEYTPGFANSGFDPYDLGDNTVGGDFEGEDNTSSVALTGGRDSFRRGYGGDSRPRSALNRSPSVHTLDQR